MTILFTHDDPSFDPQEFIRGRDHQKIREQNGPTLFILHDHDDKDFPRAVAWGLNPILRTEERYTYADRRGRVRDFDLESDTTRVAMDLGDLDAFEKVRHEILPRILKHMPPVPQSRDPRDAEFWGKGIVTGGEYGWHLTGEECADVYRGWRQDEDEIWTTADLGIWVSELVMRFPKGGEGDALNAAKAMVKRLKAAGAVRFEGRRWVENGAVRVAEPEAGPEPA